MYLQRNVRGVGGIADMFSSLGTGLGNMASKISSSTIGQQIGKIATGVGSGLLTKYIVQPKSDGGNGGGKKKKKEAEFVIPPEMLDAYMTGNWNPNQPVQQPVVVQQPSNNTPIIIASVVGIAVVALLISKK